LRPEAVDSPALSGDKASKFRIWKVPPRVVLPKLRVVVSQQPQDANAKNSGLSAQEVLKKIRDFACGYTWTPPLKQREPPPPGYRPDPIFYCDSERVGL